MFLRFTKTRDYADYYSARPNKKQTNTFHDFVCCTNVGIYYYNVVVIRRRWVWEKHDGRGQEFVIDVIFDGRPPIDFSLQLLLMTVAHLTL